MDRVSGEIIDLINNQRLEDLKKIKPQLRVQEYAQSKNNILSTRDEDSYKLKKILNEIEDPDVLSVVISSLKMNITTNGNHSYIDESGNIDINSVKKDIVEIQVSHINQKDIKDSKKIVEAGIATFTVAELHKMANNFNELTKEQQDEVIRNWGKLSSDDRIGILDDLGNYFKQNKDKYTEEENTIITDAIDSSKKAENINDINWDELTDDQKLQIITDIMECKDEEERTEFEELLQSGAANYQKIWDKIRSEFNQLGGKKVALLNATRNGEQLHGEEIKNITNKESLYLSRVVERFEKFLSQVEDPKEKKKLERNIAILNRVKGKKEKEETSAIPKVINEGENEEEVQKLNDNGISSKKIDILNLLGNDITIKELTDIENGNLIYKYVNLYSELVNDGLMTSKELEEKLKIFRTYICSFRKREQQNSSLSKTEVEDQKKENLSKIETELNEDNSIESRYKRQLESGKITEEEYNEKIQKIFDLKEKREQSKTISKEIEKMDIILSENFSKQEISEALILYKNYLLNSSADDIAFLAEQTYEDRSNILTEELLNLETDKKISKILELIAQNDFGGNLKTILTSPELLQENFLPAIEAEIKKLEEPEMDFVESKEQQTSQSFDQKSIQDELAAIPVALSNVEGIETKDIVAGMQGYKQVLDGIDVNSLQGKSNEEVLNILTAQASNIGLEGNANAILLMMSQIGFSQNGNKQIASILIDSKEAFTALVDEASKEENIRKSIDERKDSPKISDKEAMPGMKALIVDLKVAKVQENQLGDQLVSDDDTSSVADSTSDTDTTTSSTAATKKLKPQNLIGLIVNAKTSDIKKSNEEIKEANKDEQDKDIEEVDGPDMNE